MISDAFLSPAVSLLSPSSSRRPGPDSGRNTSSERVLEGVSCSEQTLRHTSKLMGVMIPALPRRSEGYWGYTSPSMRPSPSARTWTLAGSGCRKSCPLRWKAPGTSSTLKNEKWRLIKPPFFLPESLVWQKPHSIKSAAGGYPRYKEFSQGGPEPSRWC